MIKIILGVTNLLVNGKLADLLKCLFCNFRNIHEEVITHHIEFAKDTKHNVDLKRIDKSCYIVSAPETSSYGPYVPKENLPLPWIDCRWYDYRDKIKFDLSLHFLEEHKKELLTLPITAQERKAAKALSRDRFVFLEGPMEYRLDKAVRTAEE